MDLGSVVVAVAGVAGTLGGALLTQRATERTRMRELAAVHRHEEVREQERLRRTCFNDLHRESRRFNTALRQHLHALQEGRVGSEDVAALDEAKQAHRDRHSEALLIAPEEVLTPADAVNRALTGVYGQVRRLERAEPLPGETMGAAIDAQHRIWSDIRVMREAIRQEIGTVPASPPS